MTLKRRSDRPNRKGHKWAAWDDAVAVETGGGYGTDPRSTEEYATLRSRVNRRANGQCEADFDGHCRSVGEDPHHIYPPSEGGPVIAPAEWMLWVCRPCHAKIHTARYRPVAELLRMIVPLDRKPIEGIR